MLKELFFDCMWACGIVCFVTVTACAVAGTIKTIKEFK